MNLISLAVGGLDTIRLLVASLMSNVECLDHLNSAPLGGPVNSGDEARAVY